MQMRLEKLANIGSSTDLANLIQIQALLVTYHQGDVHSVNLIAMILTFYFHKM